MKAKRILNDHITSVKDTPVFRNALIAEYDKGSRYVVKSGEDYLLTSAKTAIIYKGIESVAIARIDDAELAWFESLPQASIIGKAKDQYIRSFDDVEWLVNGEQAYYNCYDRTPTSHTDENGDTIETIPPELHGTLASKPKNYM